MLFLLDEVGGGWIRTLSPSAESLGDLYSPERPRVETYRAMVERILSFVRRGLDVCVAFYGHPGIFVDPSHDAIRRAREEGYEATMIAGVSAEDCLAADLGVDPGRWGWHAYEASEFLMYGRRADPSVQLVLWQIGAVGEIRAREGPDPAALVLLADRLQAVYGPDHEAVLYQASPYPIGGPAISRVRLGDLASVEIPPLATLYVPPAAPPALDDRLAKAFGVLPGGSATGRGGSTGQP